MPNFDGTGPLGRGAQTGGGMGRCAGANRLMGGNRRGGGFGSGAGQKFRNGGYGCCRTIDAVSGSNSEKEILESRLSAMKSHILAIEQRLAELNER